MNAKKTNRLGAVQGDVPIIRIDRLPEDAKPTENRIVAYGETTGHNHQVQGVKEAYENPAGFYFVVAPDEKAEMVHTSNGDHGTIEMAPGLYFVPRVTQVEYDGEMERRVAD